VVKLPLRIFMKRLESCKGLIGREAYLQIRHMATTGYVLQANRALDFELKEKVKNKQK
jgi:hypothetical protein